MPNSRPAGTVYVVDGNAAVREGLMRLMDAAGKQAHACESLAELLQQAQRLRNACVLVDVQAWRQCPPDLRGTVHYIASMLPFIVLSSGDNPSARRQARELGARAFFHKPVDAAALLDAIDWVLHGDGPED